MTGETLPGWMLTPFEDPEFMARELTGSATHGVIKAAEQRNKIIPYSGGEMSMRYYLSGTGVGRSQGFLLFLNGIPQPYAIDRETPMPGDDEYRFLHTVDIAEDKSKADFTMRFFPVTGQEGDSLDLCVGAILHAGFVPKNPRQFAFYPYYRLHVTDYVLDLQATPSKPPELAPQNSQDSILSALELVQEDMSSEELAFATSQSGSDEDTETQWELSLNEKNARSMAHLNLDQYDRLDFTFKLRGMPGSQWQVVLYLDHEPLVIDDKNHFTLDVVRGKKSVLNFSLDPDLLHGVHTFYIIAMPVREINAQGRWMSFNLEVQTVPWTIYRASEWRDWEPETD